ncbi:MAG: hypothetical protein F4117_02270, partial [Acidimicrobiales bacterium]|nr:hypothetical protein [Acidimicrobiales bacterium]MYI11374.1 hypothetical protein [Acidimicrobiales bacterium]
MTPTMIAAAVWCAAAAVLWAVTGLVVFPGVLAVVLVWGAWEPRRSRRAEGADWRRFTLPPALPKHSAACALRVARMKQALIVTAVAVCALLSIAGCVPTDDAVTEPPDTAPEQATPATTQPKTTTVAVTEPPDTAPEQATPAITQPKTTTAATSRVVVPTTAGSDFWGGQAAEQAKSYLSYSAFSKQGLIEQLEY